MRYIKCNILHLICAGTNNNMKILVVEDERSLQKALCDTLTSSGYETLSALDGEEAISMVAKEKPNLILLDLILPKKDGFEVLKEIKSNTDFKDVPVIVLTNLEGSADVERALALGATTYLVKANYELSDIVEKIKKILS